VSGARDKHVPGVPGQWRLDFRNGWRRRWFIRPPGVSMTVNVTNNVVGLHRHELLSIDKMSSLAV
jgi:hypothetical protein